MGPKGIAEAQETQQARKARASWEVMVSGGTERRTLYESVGIYTREGRPVLLHDGCRRDQCMPVMEWKLPYISYLGYIIPPNLIC